MKKKCSKCDKEKSLKEFYKDKTRKGGFSYECKNCTIRRQKESNKKYPERHLLNVAKSRAKKYGIPFNITVEDIVISKVCPVFKKPFIYGKRWHSFSISLDRIDNTKGYIKRNVVVISRRANTLKSNASKKELKALSDFYNN